MQRVLFLLIAFILIFVIALGFFFHSRFIGKEAALSSALADAGVLRDDAMVRQTEMDFENGRFTYSIEFTASGTEYEYLIAARDGRILEKDVEPSAGVVEPPAGASASAGTGTASEPAVTEAEDIGVENAKAAALTKAGLGTEDVLFRKVSRELEDGRWIYNVEFVSGGREYDYEIDSNSGAVLSEDIDS